MKLIDLTIPLGDDNGQLRKQTDSSPRIVRSFSVVSVVIALA